VSSAVKKSASLSSPSRSPNRALAVALHLPLQVFAVILNAVKDPEEFHSPHRSNFSTHTFPPLPLF
jgi:hypothetical protein